MILDPHHAIGCHILLSPPQPLPVKCTPARAGSCRPCLFWLQVLYLFGGWIRWAVNPVVPHLTDEAGRRSLLMEALPPGDGGRVVAPFLLLERGEKAGRVTARGDGRPGGGRCRRGGGASVPGWVGSGGVHVYGVQRSGLGRFKEQLDDDGPGCMLAVICTECTEESVLSGDDGDKQHSSQVKMGAG